MQNRKGWQKNDEEMKIQFQEATNYDKTESSIG